MTNSWTNIFRFSPLYRIKLVLIPSTTSIYSKRTNHYKFSLKLYLVVLTRQLATKTLPLESVDHVHGSDSLPLGVLSVGDTISDDVLQEDLQNSTSPLIDEYIDPLDSSTAGQSPDSLDVAEICSPRSHSEPQTPVISSFACGHHVWSVLIVLSQNFLVFRMVSFPSWYKSQEILVHIFYPIELGAL